MRLAPGGGGGGVGRRREARSGSRLSVSAPPPPPRALFLKKHSNKSEGTSLVGVVGGARKTDSKNNPAASSSSLSLASRRPTLLRIAGDATRDAQQQQQPADASVQTTILKTTRTRKAQNTTKRLPTARRTVRFDRCVRMVLVPARRDLDAAIVDGVWWGAEDVAEFRVAAAKHFLKHGGRRMMMARRSSIGDDAGDANPPEEVPDKQGGGTKSVADHRASATFARQQRI